MSTTQNSNGHAKRDPKNVASDATRGGPTVVACLVVITIFGCGFLSGGLALLLVAQPALLNLVAACLARPMGQ